MPRELDMRNLDFTTLVRPGDHVVWGQGSGEPLTLVERFLAQRHQLKHASVFVGGLSYSKLLKPEHADVLELLSCGAMAELRALARAQVLKIIPCHLSQLPGCFANGTLRADVVFLHASPPDADGVYSFALTNDYLQAAMARARVVIAEVNQQAPWTYCDGPLTADRIDYVVPVSRPPIQSAALAIGEVENAIARHVGRYIEDGTTIQIGIGAIPDAIMSSLGDRRDLGIHSGLISDRVADLMESGALTNARKPIDPGIAACGTLRGTRRLYDFADRNRAIKLFPLTYTHNAMVLARLGRIVAINSAIEVDLTGQINAEVAGGDYIGSIGGQGDFVRGAQLSPEGRSVIALPATAQQGKTSRIVARLSGPVTTARSDADLIVTEYGVAELRGQPLPERARRMVAISHPAFREALDREAHAFFRDG